jgi:predicted RNA-binding protein with PUA-like domain
VESDGEFLQRQSLTGVAANPDRQQAYVVAREDGVARDDGEIFDPSLRDHEAIETCECPDSDATHCLSIKEPAMAYWLFKSEPEAWSWEQQKAKGAKGEPWSGVRNFTAAKNMREMKKGDQGYFYHSGDERSIVGIVEVIGEYRPDPSDEKGRFGLVDVKAVRDVPKPVTLQDIKANAKLKQMSLVKFSRLSVQPVTPAEWKIVCAMGGIG